MQIGAGEQNLCLFELGSRLTNECILVSERDRQIINHLLVNSMSFLRHANNAAHERDLQAELEQRNKDWDDWNSLPTEDQQWVLDQLNRSTYGK